MKPRIVVLLVVLLLFAFFIALAQTCASTRAAERRERTREHRVYLSESQALRDTIARLTREGVARDRRYLTLKPVAQAAAETILVHARDDTALVFAVGRIMQAGEACNAAWESCHARVTLETRRADLADRAASAARAGELAEIRRGRAWRPFSLKPPGLVWVGGLVILGMVLRPS